VVNHGLQTGDIVEYNNNGNTVIDGLTGPVQEEQENPDGGTVLVNVLRQYVVLNVYLPSGVVNPDNLSFGATFDAAEIDPHTETIVFDGPHKLLSGDKVAYSPAFGNALGLSALTGTDLYVLVVDESRIRLVDTEDKALNPQDYFSEFTPDTVSGDTITTVNNHGFSENQAVTYLAPAGKTFLTGSVDVNIGSPNPDGSANLTPNASANNIHFVDADGKSTAHGFLNGERVIYSAFTETGEPGLTLGGLAAGGLYRVKVLNDYTLQMKWNDVVTTSVVYLRSGAGDTITRSSGSWLDNGFKPTSSETL